MLLKRVRKIWQADVHSILDQIEDPQSLLRQSLREMEAALEQQQVDLGEQQSEYERIEKQVASIVNNMSQLDQELDLCIHSDNDELAKNIVKRKLQAKKLKATLVSQNDQRRQAIESKINQIEEQTIIYEGLKQKAEAVSKDMAVSADEDFSNPSISTEEVEIALLKEKAARNGRGEVS